MRGKIGGIGLIYLFAATGLVLVAVSLLGNIISSFFHSDNGDVLTIENYRLLFGDKDLLDVLWRTIMLGVGTVFWLFLFAETIVCSSRACPVTRSPTRPVASSTWLRVT